MLIFSFIYIQHYFLNSPTSSFKGLNKLNCSPFSEQTWYVSTFPDLPTFIFTLQISSIYLLRLQLPFQRNPSHMPGLHASSNYPRRNNLLIFQITLWGGNFVDKFCHIKNFDLLLPKCLLSPFFFGFQYLCHPFCCHLAPTCVQVSKLFSTSQKVHLTK